MFSIANVKDAKEGRIDVVLVSKRNSNSKGKHCNCSKLQEGLKTKAEQRQNKGSILIKRCRDVV